MNSIKMAAVVILMLAIGATAHAQVPQIMNYQGRITVGGTNFDGTGQFKFALVDGSGAMTFWSNGTAAVSLTVTKGQYSVLLGDTPMTAIPPLVFTNSDVRLRVWFNDGVSGFQQLSPDQRIASVGYAMVAGNVSGGATSSSPIPNMQVFNSNGTFTVPAGVTRIMVELWGGGGAGGNGGGGGGYGRQIFSVTPGDTYTVTVGLGGPVNGGNGGTSSFGSLISATGGNSSGGGGTSTAPLNVTGGPADYYGWGGAAGGVGFGGGPGGGWNQVGGTPGGGGGAGSSQDVGGRGRVIVYW